jgi:uncharacterized Tic20 family protein
MIIDWSSINFLPVIAGGIVYMVYGGIYYSIALSKKKKQDQEFLQNESKGPFKYIYSVILAFIISFILAVMLHTLGSESLAQGAGIGFTIGAIISMVYLKNALFGLMSKKSCLIAIGDHLLIFTLLGTIQQLFM